MVTLKYKANKTIFTIIHFLSPLLIVGLLYILFRSTDLRMFKWFSFIGLDELIHLARETAFPLQKLLPVWTYYSLPDGLWVYSFSSTLIFWNGKLTFWLFLPLMDASIPVKSFSCVSDVFTQILIIRFALN